jgi:hypothetical protein
VKGSGTLWILFWFNVLGMETIKCSRITGSGMDDSGPMEHYPVSTVVVALLLSLLIYGIGALLMAGFGILWAVVYLAFAFAFELRLLATHCVDCYYFGKTCAFGRGRLAGLLFRKGNPERFTLVSMTWKDIVPDFLLFIVPALAGVVLLLMAFSLPVLLLVVALLVLGFAGNAFVRGTLACRFCRQREIGCPAEKLVEKK